MGLTLKDLGVKRGGVFEDVEEWVEDKKAIEDAEVLLLDWVIKKSKFGENREYAVIKFQDTVSGKKFGVTMGSNAIVDLLKNIENMGLKEKVKTEGVVVKFVKKKSKSGMEYWSME